MRQSLSSTCLCLITGAMCFSGGRAVYTPGEEAWEQNSFSLNQFSFEFCFSEIGSYYVASAGKETVK